MPVTPFHMGPGLAIKAAAGASFSVLTFGLAQVAMDIEPLLGLLLGWEMLHARTHNLPVATAIALGLVGLAPPICRALLRMYNAAVTGLGVGWLAEPWSGARLPVVLGAFVGTWSHVGLDALMHLDVWPLAPISHWNPLLDAVPTGALHVGCTVLGVAGAAAWVVMRAVAEPKRPAG